MSLVKWFRKNMKMLMAVFVIGILFAFIGGTQVLEALSRERPRDEGSFADGQAISNMDRNDAGLELEMLRRMQAPAFLQRQGLHGLLLGQLLFSDGRPDPGIIGGLNQMMRQGELHVTEKQLLDLFSEQGAIKPIYWILLKHEAREAGMGMNGETVARIINEFIYSEMGQQLFGGQSYEQLLYRMRASYKVPEEQIVRVFGDLLAVLRFSQLATHTTDVTTSQIQHQSSWAHETVEAQFVKLEAKTFLDAVDPNASPDLAVHFNTYRSFSAGQISPENEHGFGYRLPDRIRLDYLVVKLGDLKDTVGEPTQDEKEAYYSRHAPTLFTRLESPDPNDPNLPMVEVTDPYAKVVINIHERLVTEKVLAKAMMILQEARSDSRLQVSEEEARDLSPEKVQEHADDYSLLAQELSQKYEVPLHAGQTGRLSRADASSDTTLTRWSLEGPSGERISVATVLFNVSPLEADDLQLLSLPKPFLFENLGPLRDAYTRPGGDVSGQTMAIVRVVEVAPATMPDSLETTYESTGVTLDSSGIAKTISIKDQVAEDVRQLQAYAAAEAQAQEFITAVKQEGWDLAVTQLNKSIKEKTRQDPNSLDPITVRKQILHRMPVSQLDLYTSLIKRSPGSAAFLQKALGESQVADALYERIPSNQDQASDVPFVMKSPSEQAVYCINDVSVKRFSVQAFHKTRGAQIQREERIAAQSLAAIHFNPQNLIARMNYHPLGEASDTRTDDTGK